MTKIRQNRLIKVILPVFIGLMMIFMTAGLALAANAAVTSEKNEETGYMAVIVDQADLLTDSEEQSLMEYVKNVTKYCSAVFVTSTDSHSNSVIDYAKDVLEKIGSPLGFNGYESVIFVIDMYSRELTLYAGETTAKVITSSISNSITDNTYSYASKGDYYGCAKEAFTQIFKVLDGQKIAQPMRYITAALLAVFAGLGISLIMVRSKTKKKKETVYNLTSGLTVDQYVSNTSANLISSRRVPHVEVHTGGGGFHGGGGGGFSGGGGGGFHGGGGGGFSGGGGGGFSGGGSGGSHRF